MQLHWHTEPLLLITLLIIGWLYALALGPLRNQMAREVTLPIRKILLFYLGLVITYLAVGSPLDQIGEQFLFSAHMVQHILLIYVSPVLFILGTPQWLIDWLLKPKCVHKPMRILTYPATGGILFLFIFISFKSDTYVHFRIHDIIIRLFTKRVVCTFFVSH